ncbi:DUF1642 domain-containing protein [Streptococcus suis]|nr:DUF1642 domain-containing protein [Streptococcus suis]MBY5039439.1 DUF1642 domain-containing protein [Streptococcus suis]
MNKQEAINRVEELYGYGSIAKTVTDIISQIHEPQKVVVPKVVATWIEYCKQSNLDLDHSMRCTRVNNAETGVEEWIYENQETFARAWLDGYTIEQERLYTVEIPNPNATHNDVYILGRTLSGDISIWRINRDSDIKNYDSDFQLTEAEIKQDFEWAWQFAKEVE